MNRFFFTALIVVSALLPSVRLMAQDATAAPTTYTGHVDGVKDLSGGVLVVNLDGAFPDSKMTLFFGAQDKAKFTRLPVVGDTITATGPVIQFKGHPEIKMTDPAQLTFSDAGAATPPATPPAAPPAAGT